MYCSNCGAKIEKEQAKFCGNCGTKTDGAKHVATLAARPKEHAHHLTNAELSAPKHRASAQGQPSSLSDYDEDVSLTRRWTPLTKFASSSSDHEETISPGDSAPIQNPLIRKTVKIACIAIPVIITAACAFWLFVPKDLSLTRVFKKTGQKLEARDNGKNSGKKSNEAALGTPADIPDQSITDTSVSNDALYQKAQTLIIADPLSAKNIFTALGNYKDSSEKIIECDCYAAVNLLNAGDYSGAYDAFSALGDCKDAVSMRDECRYQIAKELLLQNDYDGAYERFGAMESYKDSAEQARESLYQKGKAALAKKDYTAAYNIFVSIASYKDANNMQDECRYQEGVGLYEAQDYVGAAERFSAIRSYKDAAALLAECGSAQEIAADSDFILPFSSTRALTDADLRYLSKDFLRIARNEIYARYGRVFADKNLQDYFNGKSWYKNLVKLPPGTEPTLTKLERNNIELIQTYEKKYP